MINAAARYRRALKKQLRCTTAVRSRLLADFDNTLDAYLEEHTEPTIGDLSAAFGPPEEMASILMAQTTPQEQAHYRKKTIAIRALAYIFAGILVLFTIYIWFLKDIKVTAVDSSGIISPTSSNYSNEQEVKLP